ncbi:MAG TPA: redoxin family protein [Bryobacteraceae bacterium]|nr:redoxin family protein [Bryobacteraceae bacterium]
MTKLETATHVAVIALCCLAGGLLIEQRFFSTADDGESPSRSLVGREVKLPGADWQSAPVSILLQISSTCDYCNESMPFYKQLMATREAQGAKVPVIVVSHDAVDVMRKHLADQQVAVDKVLHSRMDQLGTMTPTIYVVDSNGRVKRAFVGELDASGEKQVLSIVERGRV